MNESRATASTPVGINHVVFNVRDIEVSHRFWTEMLGFRQTGAIHPAPGENSRFRFYSGVRDDHGRHHDFALAQGEQATPAGAQSLNHVAVEYADRAAWQAQIDFLLEGGVELFGGVERRHTHSVHLHDPDGILVELLFELPRAGWEDDIDGALNSRRSVPVAG